MIRETTYNTKELRQEIAAEVGRPIPIIKRLRMGGNGSQRLVIVEAFKDLEVLIDVDNRSKFCNIELRENGVILHFRSRLESFAWVVPFHILSLFKSDDSLSIYAGAQFVRVKAAHNSMLNHKFINKILKLKAEKYTQQNELKLNYGKDYTHRN
jgi:hypothetical protein